MSQKRFGLFGEHSRDFLTYYGRILWHDDAAEMAYLVPLGTHTIREIPRDIPDDLMVPLREHHQMDWVEWPLDRSKFRRP